MPMDKKSREGEHAWAVLRRLAQGEGHEKVYKRGLMPRWEQEFFVLGAEKQAISKDTACLGNC